MTKKRRCWLQRQLNICALLIPLDALGLGALTALLKENGSIRGIVTGDTFRRGVARTLAQQCAKKFEEACMPFPVRAFYTSRDRMRYSDGSGR